MYSAQVACLGGSAVMPTMSECLPPSAWIQIPELVKYLCQLYYWTCFDVNFLEMQDGSTSFSTHRHGWWHSNTIKSEPLLKSRDITEWPASYVKQVHILVWARPSRMRWELTWPECGWVNICSRRSPLLQPPRCNDLINSLIQLADQRRCNVLSHRKKTTIWGFTKQSMPFINCKNSSQLRNICTHAV